LSGNSCSKGAVHRPDRIHIVITYPAGRETLDNFVFFWPSTTLCFPLEKRIIIFKFQFLPFKSLFEPIKWTRYSTISYPIPKNQIIHNQLVITIVIMSVFNRLALYIVSAPVEEKGYKRIFKLPD